MSWRLILDSARDAFSNMAIDYALLKLNSVPTLRLYQWEPSAVSIGYFQSMEEEIDIKRCKELGIDYVRRITGGGAVFHDSEITYSLTIQEENEFIPKAIQPSYDKICSAIVRGLAEIGLEGKYVPLNDIIVNGKKISGCAQTRKERTLLQHGTMIMDVDVDKMFSILLIPNEKIKGKMIASVKDRVTSIKAELSNNIDPASVKDALAVGFEKEFNIRFENSDLTKEELELAKKLKKEIFSAKEWTFKR